MHCCWLESYLKKWCGISDMLEFVIFSIVLVEVLLIFWLHSSKPDKTILKQYSNFTVLRAQTSLSSNWSKGLRQEDIPAFLAFRKRFRIWALSIVALLSAFLYVVWSTGQWAQTQIKNFEENIIDEKVNATTRQTPNQGASESRSRSH